MSPKNISKNLLFFIFFLTFSILFIGIFQRSFFPSPSQNSIIFSYPKNDLVFAGVTLKNMNDNYLIKERFDKEFLNVSYNLYQFFLYVKRLPLYMPYIEEQLEIFGLPDDLKYLPIAESALRNDVVSSAGAAGIWQFMPDTARDYGLIVNDDVDERYHFEKSTQAALKYLDFLYKKFEDWPLALASYNRWQNAISRALLDQWVNNFFDLYLNEETSRYFFRILAIKYVIEDYETKKENIDHIIGGVYEIPQTQKIKVKSITNLKDWAKQNNYDYLTLRSLNRWIIWEKLPEWNWEIEVIEK